MGQLSPKVTAPSSLWKEHTKVAQDVSPSQISTQPELADPFFLKHEKNVLQ